MRQQFYWVILARNGVTPIAVHVKRRQLIRPKFAIGLGWKRVWPLRTTMKTVNWWVTHAAARHAVQLLQRYFVKQGFSALASFKQTTLDSFFL